MSTSTAPGAKHSSGKDFVATLHSDTYPYIDPKQANLSGHHIVITGASRGIGRATAASFAAGGASALVLAARSDVSQTAAAARAAATAAGRPEPRIVAVQVDVSDAASVEAAAERVRAELGHVDVLINNAGASEVWTPLISSEPASWGRTIDINLTGVYLVTRFFAPLLLASPRPSKTVVSLSSIGQNVMLPGASSYQISKLALARFAEFVQLELGGQGLLAYNIHPGAVMTDLANESVPQEMREIFVDTPALPGDTLVWLTKERREWLAGRYVDCNWDMQEFEATKDAVVKGDLLKVRMAVGGGANIE